MLNDRVLLQTASFLGPMAQLCHRYSNLAHTVWIDLFPQLWNLLTEKQQQVSNHAEPNSNDGATICRQSCLYGLSIGRAKNWHSHGRQWRVKTDHGYQKLRFERPMCDYATEFRKSAM